MHRLHKTGRAVCRIVSVFALMFVVVVTANAYTVVMRGGRRIEIPARFVVTDLTLTYETAPGIQITLNIAAIDIPATEKANNEPAGSLMKRAEEDLPGAVPTAPATAARRTITNRDLESTALRRRQSELAYESRRKELGLPSVKESREQAAAESELLAMELEEQRLAQGETENYWRERAAGLRTEMAAVDAEIGWIRARLDEGPATSSNWNAWGSFSNVIGVAPFGNFHNRGFGNFGGRGRFPAGSTTRRGVFVAPNRGRVAFGGGATRGRVFINPGFRPARPIGNLGGFPVFPQVFPSSVLPTYDFTYERGALISRFNELGAARAGLNVRWRELEEEARRAGAQPGWLRP